MSERGSFVTEYIYCEKCFAKAKKILYRKDKQLYGTAIKGLPIIAGKVGGTHSGDELNEFFNTIIPDIEEIICHNVRIAVIAESGENIFTATPAPTTYTT